MRDGTGRVWAQAGSRGQLERVWVHARRCEGEHKKQVEGADLLMAAQGWQREGGWQ